MDALKRFIEQIESKAIEQKRIAQQKRHQSLNFDHQFLEKTQKAKLISKNIENQVVEQIIFQKQQKQILKKQDLAIPDIEGTQGYPPLHEDSRQEVLQKKEKEA